MFAAEWVTTTTILDDLRGFGNDAAWRRFVERFRLPVIRFARSLGVTEPDAEDVAQETLTTFARALREGRYDRSKGRLSRWLFGIAYRKVLKQRERAPRDRAAGDQTSFWGQIPDEHAVSATWDREWEDAVWTACLDRVRSEFEPTTLAAFERVVRDDKPAAAVAGELGVPVKTVYNAKHRVLKRLRELRADLEIIR